MSVDSFARAMRGRALAWPDEYGRPCVFVSYLADVPGTLQEAQAHGVAVTGLDRLRARMTSGPVPDGFTERDVEVSSALSVLYLSPDEVSVGLARPLLAWRQLRDDAGWRQWCAEATGSPGRRALLQDLLSREARAWLLDGAFGTPVVEESPVHGTLARLLADVCRLSVWTVDDPAQLPLRVSLDAVLAACDAAWALHADDGPARAVVRRNRDTRSFPSADRS